MEEGIKQIRIISAAVSCQGVEFNGVVRNSLLTLMQALGNCLFHSAMAQASALLERREMV